MRRCVDLIISEVAAKVTTTTKVPTTTTIVVCTVLEPVLVGVLLAVVHRVRHEHAAHKSRTSTQCHSAARAETASLPTRRHAVVAIRRVALRRIALRRVPLWRISVWRIDLLRIPELLLRRTSVVYRLRGAHGRLPGLP